MADLLLGTRTCLVTGAGSGIGRAIAIEFARQGAKVALLGRTAEELNDVAQFIENRGGFAQAFVADVTDEVALNRTVEKISFLWGPINVVVANAGVNGVWAPIDKLEADEFRQTIDINLCGAFLTLKAAFPAMKQHGGSAIVIASINGTRVFSNAGSLAYSCSKAAQVALTKILALELAKHRIRVNVVCPGAIETPIHDQTVRRDVEAAAEPVDFPEGSIPLTDGRCGAPEDIAGITRFLATDDSSHITGAVIHVDGGQSLLQG